MRLTMALSTLWALRILMCYVAEAHEGPDAATIESSAKSVVQVISRSCHGPDRTGSGFVWSSTSTVVTANHVVDGCDTISAYVGADLGGNVDATVDHVLVGPDLAMLHLARPLLVSPLKAASVNPAVDDEVQAIGYYFGVPTKSSVALRIALGSSQLQDMLPTELQKALSDSGSIDLSTEVLRLGGSLEPGLSGSPLINDQGEVAGIGSGGLENGFVAISWAVRAHYLSGLASAPAPIRGSNNNHAEGLFAQTVLGSQPTSLQCGGHIFIKTRIRKLEDVIPTSDDVPGLIKLASTSGFDFQRLKRIYYQVFTEANSGAAVAIPSGMTLQRSGSECWANNQAGLSIRMVASNTAGPLDTQAASVSFEQGFSQDGFNWVPNQAFSYSAPLQRADGLVTNRKSGVGNDGTQIRALTFETLMARVPLFVGIQIKNTNVDQKEWSRCLSLPAGDASCSTFHKSYDLWAAAVLGAQMSTFPIK